MTAYEDIAVALTLVLAIGTVVMVYLGLRGLTGGSLIVRCKVCDHWTFSSGGVPPPSCANCRHPALMHPLQALHHQRHYAPARVGEPYRS